MKGSNIRSGLSKLTEWRDELSSRLFIAFEDKKTNLSEQIKGVVERSSAELSVNPSPENSKGRVLFFSPRWWSTHCVLESVMAYSLRFTGYSPEFLICGKGMKYCDLYRPGDEPGRKCAYCKNKESEYFTNAGLPFSAFPDYVNVKDEMARAERLVASLTIDDCRKFELDGVPLGWLTEQSVIRSLRCVTIEDQPYGLDSFRQYLSQAIIVQAVSNKILEQDWKFIVVLNGLFFAEGILIHMARAKGVDVITYERGFERQTLFFGRNAIANLLKLDHLFVKYKDIPLTDEQDREVQQIIDIRRQGKMGLISYFPKLEDDRKAIFGEFGIDGSKPITMASPNILWDTAAVRREIAFNGLWDWLKSSIEAYAAMPGQQLVVRMHPAEVRLPISTIERLQDKIKATFKSLPSNVAVIPSESSASSYTLLDIAQRILVYTSTVGLEAALHGKEVITVADTHYRGKGFTIDAKSRDEFFEIVSKPPRKPTSEQIELARRYTHMFFYRYPVPFTTIHEVHMGRPTITFDSLDDLKSGKYTEVEFISRKFPSGENGNFLFKD